MPITDLSEGRKRLLLAMGVTLALVLDIQLILRPLGGLAARRTGEVSKLSSEHRQFLKDKAALGQWQKEQTTLERELATVTSQWDNPAAVTMFLTDVAGWARSGGIKIASIDRSVNSPSQKSRSRKRATDREDDRHRSSERSGGKSKPSRPDDAAKLYQVLIFRIRTVGSYHAIAKWVNQIEKSGWPVGVLAVKIERLAETPSFELQSEVTLELMVKGVAA